MEDLKYEPKKRVLLRAATELLPELCTKLPLLQARIRGAWLDDKRDGYCIADLELEQGPTVAAEMSPIFGTLDDGRMVLHWVEWFRADGTWIATTPRVSP
jgi:hypothetical protein